MEKVQKLALLLAIAPSKFKGKPVGCSNSLAVDKFVLCLSDSPERHTFSTSLLYYYCYHITYLLIYMYFALLIIKNSITIVVVHSCNFFRKMFLKIC